MYILSAAAAAAVAAKAAAYRRFGRSFSAQLSDVHQTQRASSLAGSESARVRAHDCANVRRFFRVVEAAKTANEFRR